MSLGQNSHGSTQDSAVIHLSKYHHHPSNHDLASSTSIINVKQTKTSQIRQSKHYLLQRHDSTDDYHHHPHLSSLSSSKKLPLSHKLIKDDHDLKTRRKFSLPSVRTSTSSDNIFNGHLIFWKLKITAQISLFYHLEFDCIEILIFDLTRQQEMERLYVIASTLFEILESYVDITEYKDRKISLSDVIKAARINCAIDFIMSHLGCEKVSFMPPAATLRYYNEKLNKVEALTTLKPLWLVPVQQQAIPTFISILYASKIRRANTVTSKKLHFIWAVRLIISVARIRKSLFSAWKRATQSSTILRKIQRTREISEALQSGGSAGVLQSLNDDQVPTPNSNDH